MPLRRGRPHHHVRPAQTSLALRPAGSLNRPRRPLSRGFDPASCPTKSLVSYRINRQLSGWNLPPQVIRAFGAHAKSRRGPPHRSKSSAKSACRPPMSAPSTAQSSPQAPSRSARPLTACASSSPAAERRKPTSSNSTPKLRSACYRSPERRSRALTCRKASSRFSKVRANKPRITNPRPPLALIESATMGGVWDNVSSFQLCCQGRSLKDTLGKPLSVYEHSLGVIRRHAGCAGCPSSLLLDRRQRLLSDWLGSASEEAMLSPDERSDLSYPGVHDKNGFIAPNKFVSDAIAIPFSRFILEP